MHLGTCPLSAGIAFLVLVVAGNFGCGGSASVPPPPPPAAISVSLSQTTATVQAGATMQFTATVANDPASKGVTWSMTCSAAACGSVSPTTTASGAATTYTAATSAGSSDLQVTLTATSVADTTKTASAAISVTPSLMPPTVSGTIAVGNAPSAIAVDSTANKIYVADFGGEGNDGICSTCYCPGVNGTLTVIDGATQSPTTTGFTYAYSNPLYLAVNAANRTLYVASRVFFTVSPTCGYSDQLGVLGESTLTQTATTHVGGAVFSAIVAVNEDTGHVYVADWHDGTVTVLDSSGNPLDTITLVDRPSGMAVNTATNKLYVATNGNNVLVVDGATNAIISTITSPNIVAPGAVAVNPTTNTIYVANGQTCFTCPNPNNVAVIDGASGSVTGTIPAGNGPTGIAVDTQTNFIYVANVGNHDFNQPGSVTVIDGATNATTTLTDSNMPYPFHIAVNSTTNKIYVTSLFSNNVTVIDGAHN